MSSRLRKSALLALAVILLFGVSRVQVALNHDRDQLGLTRVPPLENAPPVLAFTTVALGGFRGLIANALWIRASDLQDQDKFFEMMQLADWITKLEPHFVQVWLVQAWNMAYNISVKFKDLEDRWRWVRRGIELLRDDGLRFNPNALLIYRELAWFFQHKMGQNLDDAHMIYKQQWANEMAEVFGKLRRPNLDELVNPQDDDQRERARLLREKYKMDPVFMKEVDATYGPLEWRLPEAHAIYWAALGLERAKSNPGKVNPEELIQLRRVIYQSMHMAVQRGRLVENFIEQAFEFGPNLDIIPKTNFAYEQAMKEDAQNAEHISRAHRNFLRLAVYFLYLHNRVPDAAEWYKYLGEHYPDKMIIDDDTNSFPRNVTLDRYVMSTVQVDINETDRNKVQSAIEAFITRAYQNQILGEDDQHAGLRMMARKVWQSYMSQIEGNEVRVGLRPVEETEKLILERLLDPEQGLPYEYRAVLRQRQGLPPEPPPAETGPASGAAVNPPPTASTNAPSARATNAPASRR
ncbi:MAG: hypothetical protein KJ070_07525 [Verrucomicrobia bacterium]|nr:hypothetical protein [Verrucomicrobiota bacterium]